MEDPFEPEPEQLAEVIQLYPREVISGQQPGRRPTCNCPRAVRTDGSVIVWHHPSCTEVLGEPLEAIL